MDSDILQQRCPKERPVLHRGLWRVYGGCGSPHFRRAVSGPNPSLCTQARPTDEQFQPRSERRLSPLAGTPLPAVLFELPLRLPAATMVEPVWMSPGSKTDWCLPSPMQISKEFSFHGSFRCVSVMITFSFCRRHTDTEQVSLPEEMPNRETS